MKQFALLLSLLVLVLILGCAQNEQRTPPEPPPSSSSWVRYDDAAYSIQVPAGWKSAREQIGAESARTNFTPRVERSKVHLDVVAMLRSESELGEEDDPQSLADLFIQEVTRGEEYTRPYEIAVKRSSSKGSAQIVANYQRAGECSVTSVLGVIVLPSWHFIVVGDVCDTESEEYSDILLKAINSFAPSDLAQR